MNFITSTSARFDRTTLLFTILLIASGSALLLGSHFGVFRMEQVEKFWPVTLVAAGLVYLLSYPDREQS